MKRLTSHLFAVLLLPLALLACGEARGGSTMQLGNGPVQVATSISVFADMAREVGGERVSVFALIPPGADVHTFQPAPKTVKRLADVRAVFINGRGLEENLRGVLANNVPAQARLVELGAGLQAIGFEQEPVGPAPPGAVAQHADEQGGNPHFWLDVQNAKRYVTVIRDTLSAADSEGRAVYSANADRYLTTLDALDAEIKQMVAALPPSQRKLVTFHDAFPYFVKAYGLEQVGYVIRAPGREPSAQEIAALADTLRRQQVKTVFKEPQLNARLLERAAKDAGVKVAVLYSDALTTDVPSYVEMMRRNARAVSEGLK